MAIKLFSHTIQKKSKTQNVLSLITICGADPKLSDFYATLHRSEKKGTKCNPSNYNGANPHEQALQQMVWDWIFCWFYSKRF